LQDLPWCPARAGYWGDASIVHPDGYRAKRYSTVSGTTERSGAGRDVNGVSFTSSL